MKEVKCLTSETRKEGLIHLLSTPENQINTQAKQSMAEERMISLRSNFYHLVLHPEHASIYMVKSLSVCLSVYLKLKSFVNIVHFLY